MIVIKFLLLLVLVYPKIYQTLHLSCESIVPLIIMDCSKASTQFDSCCFVRINGLLSCRSWGIKFKGTIKKNGLTYQCDNPRGSLCGPTNPNSTKDCSAFSSPTNTCCYYKRNYLVGNTGCMWWGEGFKGMKSWNGFNLICSSYFLRISYIFSFILLSNLP